MKFLHTSDWHVGKTIKGRDRSSEHEAVLAELCSVAHEHDVDLVIVAGDLFESSAPPPEAERIVYAALLELAAIAPVAVVCGNHDSDRRLLAVEPLLGLGRVVTRSMLAAADDGGVLRIQTRSGEVAQVALVPFLSQRYVVKADELMSLDADQHSGMYATRVRRIIDKLCTPFSADTVNIVAAHLMIDGGVSGGGERAAHTIFEYCVNATAFPATAHYVALGHLHRTQQLGAQPPVWYCGSPLQMDFGETSDDKHVLIVEATATTPAVVTQIPLRSGRRLRKLAGTLEQLRALAGSTGDDYLRILVRESARAGLGDDVRELFGDNAVEVTIETAATRELGLTQRVRPDRSPHDLFVEYLTERDALDERVVALFDQIHEETHATAEA